MVNEKKVNTFINKWKDVEFESSCSKTPQFIEFTKDFKTAFKHALGDSAKAIKFDVGHFYISGFITLANDSIVYFSISDVRGFPGAWAKDILVRTAKSYTDYKGGSNNFCTLLTIGEKVNNLW